MTPNRPTRNENTPTIETDRLILRKFTLDDAGDLLSILSDEEVGRFLPWFTIKTLEEAEAHLEQRFLAYYTKASAYRYAICLKTDNKAIGYVNLAEDDSHDFGYGLRKDLWHRGIVTEAARAVMDRLRNADLRYITATHDVHNPRSGEVMKKMGMTYCYSYVEQCQPKNVTVTFRMYQLNFDKRDNSVYMKYWDKYPEHCIEEGV